MWLLEDEWFSLIQEMEAAGITKAQFEEFLMQEQTRRGKDIKACENKDTN